MESLEEATEHPAPPTSRRGRAIELLQMLSLLAFGAAGVLYWPGGSNVPSFALLALGTALVGISLLLPRPPKRKRRRFGENGQDFKITADRRQALAELVPDDILRDIEGSMLDVHFTTDVEMREVPYRAIGPDRVGPWADLILGHASDHEEPFDPRALRPPHIAELPRRKRRKSIQPGTQSAP